MAPWIAATVRASRSGSSRVRATARVPDALKPNSISSKRIHENDWLNTTTPSSPAPSRRAIHGSVTNGRTEIANCTT